MCGYATINVLLGGGVSRGCGVFWEPVVGDQRWKDKVSMERERASLLGTSWTPYRRFLCPDESMVVGPDKRRIPMVCSTLGCHAVAVFVSYSSHAPARTGVCGACYEMRVQKHGG